MTWKPWWSKCTCRKERQTSCSTSSKTIPHNRFVEKEYLETISKILPDESDQLSRHSRLTDQRPQRTFGTNPRRYEKLNTHWKHTASRSFSLAEKSLFRVCFCPYYVGCLAISHSLLPPINVQWCLRLSYLINMYPYFVNEKNNVVYFLFQFWFPMLPPTITKSELLSRFDTFVFDADGVLWTGDIPIPGAAEWINTLLDDETKTVFITTNNSTKTLEQYMWVFTSKGFALVSNR